MDFGVFILLIVAVSCAAGIIHKYLDVLAIRNRSGVDRSYLQDEFAALRKEIVELKTWANDLILSYDSTLQRQDARLRSLEQRALGEGRGDAAITRGGGYPGRGDAVGEPEALEAQRRV